MIPNLTQQPQPVEAENIAYSVLRPTGPLHGHRQVGKVADCREAFGELDLAEFGERACVAFVVGDPPEKRLAMPLGEITFQPFSMDQALDGLGHGRGRDHS